MKGELARRISRYTIDVTPIGKLQPMAKPKKKRTLADKADKFVCYQKSVQTPEHEVEFFNKPTERQMEERNRLHSEKISAELLRFVANGSNQIKRGKL